MKLVIGLGNVGERYAQTRHNIGFMVIDQLATDLAASWRTESKFKAAVSETSLGDQRIILAKPQTMMNLSGQAVQKIMRFYKINPANVWTIFDDVDVPFGRLRLRRGGTSGQQGIRSTIQQIGPDFVRVRMGISLNDRSIETSEVYVLKPFNGVERPQLPTVTARAAGIIASELAQDQLNESTFDLL